MEVTRDVILDLLPLYLSGEASADTQNLVREFLERDADLARLASQWQQRLTAPPPPPVRLDAQALAYRDARRWMAIKTIAIAAVIAAAVLALMAVATLCFFVPSG